jgi:hypothetical protein
MKTTTFEQLAKDFKKISENLVEVMDSSIRSCALAIGTALITRTPKDTSQASINWVARVDSEYFDTLPPPVSPEILDMIKGSGMRAGRKRRKLLKPDRTIAVANAYKQIVTTANQFNILNNTFISYSNNLDYIGKLAYENWAWLPHTKPHAPPYWMIEDNMEENDFWVWFHRADSIFKGL